VGGRRVTSSVSLVGLSARRKLCRKRGCTAASSRLAEPERRKSIERIDTDHCDVSTALKAEMNGASSSSVFASRETSNCEKMESRLRVAFERSILDQQASKRALTLIGYLKKIQPKSVFTHSMNAWRSPCVKRKRPERRRTMLMSFKARKLPPPSAAAAFYSISLLWRHRGRHRRDPNLALIPEYAATSIRVCCSRIKTSSFFLSSPAVSRLT